MKGNSTILRRGLMQNLIEKLRGLNKYFVTSFGKTENKRRKHKSRINLLRHPLVLQHQRQGIFKHKFPHNPNLMEHHPRRFLLILFIFFLLLILDISYHLIDLLFRCFRLIFISKDRLFLPSFTLGFLFLRVDDEDDI